VPVVSPFVGQAPGGNDDRARRADAIDAGRELLGEGKEVGRSPALQPHSIELAVPQREDRSGSVHGRRGERDDRLDAGAPVDFREEYEPRVGSGPRQRLDGGDERVRARLDHEQVPARRRARLVTAERDAIQRAVAVDVAEQLTCDPV
jgi:hypothetical protein